MPVRHARRDESGDIADLWTELVAFHSEIDPNLPTRADDGDIRYAHFIMDRIERPDAAVFVAVNSRGVIVGYALVLMVDLVPEMFAQQKAGFLADVYVQPDSRRQGFGRALYQAVVDWCVTHNLDRLEWEVAAKNTAGRAFWRAMGGDDLMVRMHMQIEDKDANNETLPDE